MGSLAVEQHSHGRKGRRPAPGFAEQYGQLTEARRDNEWLAGGNADLQQQTLRDFAEAKQARFTSGFGEPTCRKKYRHESFRVIGTDRVPEFTRVLRPLSHRRRRIGPQLFPTSSGATPDT